MNRNHVKLVPTRNMDIRVGITKISNSVLCSIYNTTIQLVFSATQKLWKYHCKMIFIFLLFQLLLLLNCKPIEANPNENLAALNENSVVENRLSSLEKEMARMKKKENEDDKVINQLMDRLERLETSPNVTKECVCEKNIGKPKRPARLLPIQVLRRKQKSDGVEEERFYGPPSSCNDLGKLDYTLNGYYLVKSQQLNSRIVNVIYCQFKFPEQQMRYLETMIGKVELKTKSVHFYVQRTTIFQKDGVIPFQVERLNMGAAMNLTSGVFTVPLNGTYHFQFSGMKKWNSQEMCLDLQVNGVGVASGLSHDGGVKSAYSTTSLTASLRLKTGDRVNPWKTKGELYDASYAHYSHFTGWLVEEDTILG